MKSRARTFFPIALRLTGLGLLLLLPTFAFGSNPTAVSVTPSSGAGTVQRFGLTYSDLAGASDLSWVYALFTPNGDGAHACGMYYHPGDNLIYLADDNNTTVLGPGAMGSPGTLSNSQCTIDVGASGTAVIGNILELGVSVTFHVTDTFDGATSVYMYAEDNEGNDSPFQKLGTWTVDANVFPTAVDVTPSAGTGISQTIDFTYSDGNGAGDLQWVYGFLSKTADATNSCYFWYHPSDNLIYLSDDNGGSFGPVVVGQTGTLANNECSLDARISSVSRTPNTLTLNVALNFEGQPGGQKNIYLFAEDNEYHMSTPQSLGTFTVEYPAFSAVSVTSLYNGSYLVNKNTFTVTFSDTNGGSGINFAYVLFSPNNDGSHACPVYVHMPEGYVYLANDANTAVFGPGLVGSPGTLSNSQCTLDVGNASATVGPTTLTLTLPVTFASAFYGRLNVITYAEDNAGLNTGFQNIDVYTVSAPVAPNYVFGEINPTVAYAKFADANGRQDLQTLYLMLAPSFNTTASCYIRYEMATNTMYLSDDAGGWLGPGQPNLVLANSGVPAVPGSLTNHECTIYMQDAIAGYAISGTQPDTDPTEWILYVGYTDLIEPMGFSLWMNAVDNEGNSAGWAPGPIS
ncbi:MAG TPA: hypothetical protein VKB38_13520 [Terracidiphilus sp.]|nr:hypothetical protein [Terracidiphilus sp.]